MLCRFRSHSIVPHTGVQYDLQGKEVRRITQMNQNDLIQRYGKGPFFLGWHEIRQLIFEHLPANTVEFNTQVRPDCLLCGILTS